MKTNAIMKVKFGEHSLSIGHKDHLGNLNELIEIGNDYRKENGLGVYEVKELVRKKWFGEYVITLENKVLAKGGKNPHLELSDIKQVKNVLKIKKGKYGGTWAHLNILIRVAIEMNPIFADEVITTFVKGKLLEYRDITGDDFKILNNACNIFEPDIKQRIQLAKGLNYIVFNKHYKGARDKANEDELKELIELQKKLAFAVDMGYIKTFDELLNEMRKIWRDKWKNINQKSINN